MVSVNKKYLLQAKGATLVEMGMLVALLAMVTVGAVSSLGSSNKQTFAKTACFIGADYNGGGSNTSMGCDDASQPLSFTAPTPMPTAPSS